MRSDGWLGEEWTVSWQSYPSSSISRQSSSHQSFKGRLDERRFIATRPMMLLERRSKCEWMNEWMTVLLVGTFVNIDRGGKRKIGMEGRLEEKTAGVVEEMMSLCDHIFLSSFQRTYS